MFLWELFGSAAGDGATRIAYRAEGHSRIVSPFMALGFVVARDRLFQLEVQSRLTEGTLTEMVGRTALGTDRARRQLASL